MSLLLLLFLSSLLFVLLLLQIYVAGACLRFRNTWQRIKSVCLNGLVIKFQACN